MRVAVIGGGISGLAAAWLLARRHDVSLFEASATPGGHSHTVEVRLDGRCHPVDTGFVVYNRSGYPNLTAVFERLGLRSVASEMSFSVSLSQPELEWGGAGPASLFAQKSNLARPAFWGMLRDILRFSRETAGVETSAAPHLPLGDYLARHRYGRPFRDWYLLPMAAAVWAGPTGPMLDYPLAAFLRVCRNHGRLPSERRVQWLTVAGGSREYVHRLAAAIPDLRLDATVLAVQRRPTGVRVVTGKGSERFDTVVFACHSDQVLRLLGGQARGAERELLAAIRYRSKRVVLHTDPLLLPRRRALWSAWNYLAGGAGEGGRAVSVSCLLNRVQPLPFSRPLVLSFNPLAEPRPEHFIGEYHYAHPVLDAAAIDAQARLTALQGAWRSWYCGAWTGHGGHEDGLRSAIAVANGLGVRAPWQPGAVALREAA